LAQTGKNDIWPYNSKIKLIIVDQTNGAAQCGRIAIDRVDLLSADLQILLKVLRAN